MTEKRMDHLSVFKHHKKEIHELDLDVLMKYFVHKSDERIKTFGKNIFKL